MELGYKAFKKVGCLLSWMLWLNMFVLCLWSPFDRSDSMKLFKIILEMLLWSLC